MIAESVLAVLQRVGPALWAHRFYLAGGTALAIQLGHRESIDLDFFRENRFDKEAVAHTVDLGPPLPAEGLTLRWHVEGVKVECFYYPYPLLAPLLPVDVVPGLRMASPVDIGAMKVLAVGQRGDKKDFIDLYVICQRVVRLDELLRRARDKFGERFNTFHYLKSLVYFDDADTQPDPLGWPPGKWEQVKAYFTHEIPRIAKQFLSEDLPLHGPVDGGSSV